MKSTQKIFVSHDVHTIVYINLPLFIYLKGSVH
jgi:hypothetical protein